MTWSSDRAAVPSGSWFPARPAMLPALGDTSAWTLDELTLPVAVREADAAPAAAVDHAAAEEAAREQLAAAARAAEAARELALVEERERLVAEAHAQGFAAGEAAGRDEERERLASALAATEAALAQLDAGQARWTDQLQDNVCALAVAIARQVIGRELSGDAATLTDTLRRALAEFPIDQPVTIRLNPMDLAVLATSRAADESLTGTAAVAPNRQARWIADASVAAGGCMVEGRERIIDGRVDTALERIYRRITGNHA